MNKFRIRKEGDGYSGYYDKWSDTDFNLWYSVHLKTIENLIKSTIQYERQDNYKKQ